MLKVLSKSSVLILGFTGLLSAGQIVTLAGNPSSTAEFNFASGSFTLTLTNATLAHSVSDVLTDLIFSLSATGPIAYQGATGQLVDVTTSGGVIPDNLSPANWGFGVYSSIQMPAYNGAYLLCAVCGAGVTAPEQPALGVLGPGSGSGSTPYSTANASITGNAPHNPFYLNSVTFSFVGASIDAETHAESVYFSYGTQFGTELHGGDPRSPVPEPMTILLTGGALVGLVALTRCRRRSAANQ
jgi:hypothetical protein